jgi:hypothetical protein
MKKINLTVKVSYEVSCVYHVTDDIYRALEHTCDNYHGEIESYEVDDDKLASKAFDWLSDNCQEADASSWAVEIEEMLDEE